MTQTMESPSNRQPIELDDEVVEVQSKSLMSRLNKFSEQVSSTAIGQYGIKKLDNVLWIFEKTAKWSLPQNMRLNTSSSPVNDQGEDEKILPPPLTRPLPWVLFIPMLITLRMVRTGVSFLALMCGKNPVTPSVMVSFIQSRRRKLRAIKYSGLRAIRIRQIEAAEQRKNGKVSRVDLFSRLSNLFGLLLCGNYGNTVRPLKVMYCN
uniref:CSON001688 protein n=1 Tax=Culicoides sonorensis TaxID=179676 RepID=A0A336LR23_CULSO